MPPLRLACFRDFYECSGSPENNLTILTCPGSHEVFDPDSGCRSGNPDPGCPGK